MGKTLLQIGDKFNRLTVVEIKLGKRGGQFCLCECECGTKMDYYIRPTALKTGGTKSCGCLNIERIKERNFKHGDNVRGKRSYLYDTWSDMCKRCTNKKSSHYRNYGGRGISVYPEWLTSYKAFRDYILSELGHRPTDKHTLDRYPDNDGNYEPGNLRWATKSQQRFNSRRSNRYTYKGKEYKLQELCDLSGIKFMTLYNRIHTYKWSVEKAVETKKQKNQFC